jgi:hypothetical protein
MKSDHTDEIEGADHPNVEVWFFIEKDEHGYPESRTWEGLWTKPIDGSYEVLNVPFFLKYVSRGDLINANHDEFVRFSEVVQHNGHNTYRLLLLDTPSEEITSAVEELSSKGLFVEVHENGILLAVDVPPRLNQKEIDDYLVLNKDKGRWQVQDGYLATSFE